MKDFLSYANRNITLGKDGIYGDKVDYGEQLLEFEQRQKVNDQINSPYLKQISRHHSIPVMDNEVNKFLKLIPPKGRILDVGGCWGWHWRNLEIIRPDIKVFIVDFLRSNLNIAKSVLGESINENIFLIHANAINLPFKDLSFDGLWSVQTTQHIPQINQVYREFYRVLKRDGILCDYNLNHSILQFLIYKLFNKQYVKEGVVNNSFFLRRATNNTKYLLYEIFKKKIYTKYSEILFSPEYKLPLGGKESSFFGKIDCYLSVLGSFLKIFARQRSFHLKK